MWKIKEFIDTYDEPVDQQVNQFIKENQIIQDYAVVGYQRIRFNEDNTIGQYASEESSIVIKYWDPNNKN